MCAHHITLVPHETCPGGGAVTSAVPDSSRYHQSAGFGVQQPTPLVPDPRQVGACSAIQETSGLARRENILIARMMAAFCPEIYHIPRKLCDELRLRSNGSFTAPKAFITPVAAWGDGMAEWDRKDSVTFVGEEFGSFVA